MLFKGPLALHLQSNFGDTVCEKNSRAIGLFRLRAPLVANGSAVWLQGERACYASGRGIGNLEIRCALRGPTSGGGRNLEFFVPDGLAVKLDGEFAFVRGEKHCLFLRLGGEGAQCHYARGQNADGDFPLQRIAHNRNYSFICTAAKDKVCHTREVKRADRARLRSERYGQRLVRKPCKGSRRLLRALAPRQRGERGRRRRK